jgi:F-type H+-transporting ATPase subunit epsilon
LTSLDSYNRYIAVASRVVRRSLKEDKRIVAERRGESELRFAKWEVSYIGSRDERDGDSLGLG